MRILLLLLCLTVPLKALNASEPSTDGSVFFQTLQDVPAMQGLSEIEDYALVFDKPEGRIVEMVAQIEGASVENVRKYYALALPQLGWALSKPDNYTRGTEHLQMNFEQKEHKNFVRFTVEPR